MKIEIEVPDPPEGCEWEPEGAYMTHACSNFFGFRLPFRKKAVTYTDHLKAAGWPVGGVWPFRYAWAAVDASAQRHWYSYRDQPYRSQERWIRGYELFNSAGLNPGLLPPHPSDFGLTWNDSLIHRADFEQAEEQA